MATGPFRLSARLMSVNGGHATIGVWQNGGKAGELTVDAWAARLVIDQIMRDMPSVDDPFVTHECLRVPDCPMEPGWTASKAGR